MTVTQMTAPRNARELEAEAEKAIEEEAKAASEAVRTKRRTDLVMAAMAVVVKASIPPEVRQLTRAEYARRCNVSDATVSRWLADGMPSIPVGTTVRIDPIAADEWRRARGRKPTTPVPRDRLTSEDEIDVSSALSGAGLRVIGGGR